MYATSERVAEFVYEKYLQAVEAKKPGTIDNTLAAVSKEIDEKLSARWSVPFSPTPALVAYICAVISAYRIVGGLTSLVTSDASSDNEWLPLLREWKRATKMLDELATPGHVTTLPPPASELGGGTMAVVHGVPRFDMKGF